MTVALLTNYLPIEADAHFKDDADANLYLNAVPLVETVKISIGAPFENYETYRVNTINNEIFADDSYLTNSVINGPRGLALAFNIKVNDKMVGTSEGAPDERYTTFGSTGIDLFGTGDLYDYLDTSILLEGSSTGNQLVVAIRILRYAGT